MKVINKLWMGGYSLGRSFWVFYVIGTLCAFFLGAIASSAFLIIDARPVGLIIFALIFWMYYLIASVGAWQSATKSPNILWWPLLAKLVIGLSGAKFIWAFANGGALNFVGQVMGR